MYHFAGIPLSGSAGRGVGTTMVDLREWYFYSFEAAGQRGEMTERQSDACIHFDTQRPGRLMHDCSRMRTRNSPLPRQQNSSLTPLFFSLYFSLAKTVQYAPVERTHRCAEIKKKEDSSEKRRRKRKGAKMHPGRPRGKKSSAM